MEIRKYLSYTLNEYRQTKDFKIIFDALSHYFKWVKTMKNKTQTEINDFIPWMNFNAIEFLEKYLNKEMVVFEYGSGYSTIFLSIRSKKVISIEHNLEWYDIVKDILSGNNLNNINYKIVLPQDKMTSTKPNFEDPYDYSSSDENYKSFSFERYVKSIDEYPDESFDLVIIDGRSRPSCLLHAMPKVKKSGYILIDNTERDYYLDCFLRSDESVLWEKKTFVAHTPGIYTYHKSTYLKKNA